MTLLCKLSNQELELRLKDLIQKERKLLHLILEHIKEVDRRELYLAKAYSSLYEYLVKEMGYSGSSAMRRLEAARLLKEVPVLAEKIQEGSVNLSQIGELSRAIKEKERLQKAKISALRKGELLAQITSKTLPESQRILSEALDLPIKIQETQKVQKDESVRLEMTLTKEQYEKLIRCRDKASHILKQNHQDHSWASVIEVLATQYLGKNISKNISSTTALVTKRNANMVKVPTAITAKVREEFIEHFRCCQFRNPQTGKQCQSTFGLQVDHRQARWAGGSNAPENLQVLCATHNAYKYRKESGLSRL